MVSSLPILDTLRNTFSPPANKIHKCSNESNFFAALLLDHATICSLFTPCVACVTLLHESNIWNNFFFIPKALPTLKELWSQPLVWSEHLGLPRWQKERSREAVEAIWDIHSRAEKKNSRIIFGLRKEKQICDLQHGQKTVAGNG